MKIRLKPVNALAFALTFIFGSLFSPNFLSAEVELPLTNPTSIEELHLYNKIIAQTFAPEIRQLINDEEGLNGVLDTPVRVDFDGDWDHTNNWQNAPAIPYLDNKASPAAYYIVNWTENYWLIKYTFYYPRDYAKDISITIGSIIGNLVSPFLPNPILASILDEEIHPCKIDTHEGDAGGLFLIIERPFEEGYVLSDLIRGVNTNAHHSGDNTNCLPNSQISFISEPPPADPPVPTSIFLFAEGAHPIVYSAAGTHAFFFHELPADEDCNNPCNPEVTGEVIYQPTILPPGSNTVTSSNSIGYSLIDAFDPSSFGLYNQKYNPDVFSFTQIFATDEEGRGDPPGAPWRSSKGHHPISFIGKPFYDPFPSAGEISTYDCVSHNWEGIFENIASVDVHFPAPIDLSSENPYVQLSVGNLNLTPKVTIPGFSSFPVLPEEQLGKPFHCLCKTPPTTCTTNTFQDHAYVINEAACDYYKLTFCNGTLNGGNIEIELKNTKVLYTEVPSVTWNIDTNFGFDCQGCDENKTKITLIPYSSVPYDMDVEVTAQLSSLSCQDHIVSKSFSTSELCDHPFVEFISDCGFASLTFEGNFASGSTFSWDIEGFPLSGANSPQVTLYPELLPDPQLVSYAVTITSPDGNTTTITGNGTIPACDDDNPQYPIIVPFPNPATDIINVQLENFEKELEEDNGVELWLVDENFHQIQSMLTFESSATIELSEVKPGGYFVYSMVNGKEVISSKVVVLK